MDANERTELLREAMRCLTTGLWRQVERRCRMLFAGDPDDVEALLLSGLALAAMGEFRMAAPILQRVAQTRPDCRHPCRDLASLASRVSPSAVVAQYRACMRVAPDDAALRLDFADYLLEHDKPDTAVEILRPAPGTAEAQHLLGMAQAALGNVKTAITHFEAVILTEPAAPAGWANLGMMLKTERRFDAAVSAYDQAVRLAPDDPRIRVNRAVALLQGGRWSEAWRDYECRLDLGRQSWPPRERLMPALDELDGLAGKTILALHEEGFGDTLQFIRYLPLLVAAGARVIAVVPAPLTRLVGRMDGVAVQAPDRPYPEHDFWVPMFSLPRVFATTIETIPGGSYLQAEPALIAHWAGRLPRGDVRAGLVWAGQARPWEPGFTLLDRRRSAGLQALMPLLEVPDVCWISLQKDGAPTGTALFDPMRDVRDFEDTAAIVANLDVVVSVDTSIVHLAGAMGKPVFLLDRFDNCWRWLSGRTDSPWYPTLTIYRQTRQDDWSGPVEAIGRALMGLTVAARRPSPGPSPAPSRVRPIARAA